MGFFKNIILWFKVRGEYKQFFLREKSKRNTSSFMNEPSVEVKYLFEQIKDNPKFKNEVRTYRLYGKELSKHNAMLNNLFADIQNFSFSKIIENPLAINYDEVVERNDKILAVINDLDEINKKLKIYKKEYLEYKDNFEIIKHQYTQYTALQDLKNRCKDMYISEDEVIGIKDEFTSIIRPIYEDKKKYYEYTLPEELKDIDAHNKNFIARNIGDLFFNKINGRSLDNEQREAVLTNSKANLTIAGAGSGKTLTICGKVKYLIEKLHVDPSDILLMSYSSKSAEDLKKKISLINKDVTVNTFHSVGLSILKEAEQKAFTVDDSFEAVIEKFFREEIPINQDLRKKVFDYYGMYISDVSIKKFKDIGELYADANQSDFMTLKDHLLSYRNNIEKRKTIKKEHVKSNEELAIANYLFVNGIDYEYEASYKEEETATYNKRQYTPDFYFPKYGIYYEHYGIDKNGRATQFSLSGETNYIDGIKWKRGLHAKNNTTCLETYSYEFSDGTIFNKLETVLKEHGVEFNPLTEEQIKEVLASIYDGQSYYSLIRLINTFLALYKSRYEDDTYFDLMKQSLSAICGYNQKRRSIFLDICKDVYRYYINHLISEKKIDFDDMILKSIHALDGLESFKYKYIIVDEFQDISYSRLLFLMKLINHGNSKLFAVGDDWQAIYRFAGCDVNIFLEFGKYFVGTKNCFITSTHRNSQELQNIAEQFITANPEQIRKNIHSDIHLKNPTKIMYYGDKQLSFTHVLEDISRQKEYAEVLVLGRNNKDIESVLSDAFYCDDKKTNSYKSVAFPKLKINYSTVHASKGLECEFVIIINAEDSKNGFPNKIEDDPILDLVLSNKSDFEYAEERRLWYVALTRTKTYNYILVNHSCPSIFVKEIEKECLIMNGNDYRVESNPIFCPACKSGKLCLRENPNNKKKFYGCSNFPHCTYTNNDVKLVRANHRCKRCGDFMSLRLGSRGLFYGCKSYSNCRYTEDYDPALDENPEETIKKFLK